jgi:hypothetical protein
MAGITNALVYWIILILLGLEKTEISGSVFFRFIFGNTLGSLAGNLSGQGT